MNTTNRIFERINHWIRNSVSLKLFTIVFIMLLLLIPAEMIRSIISEREDLRLQAVNEVNAMWAESQIINGPVLSIPVLYESMEEEKKTVEIKFLKILPETLEIRSDLMPMTLKRGIYEVAVYKSEISIHGSFTLDKNFMLNEARQVLYNRAFLTLGITDLRGIQDDFDIQWDNNTLKVEPGSRLTSHIISGITSYIPDISNSLDQEHSFRINLKLQGSRNISFVPVGNTTRVEMGSTWTAPGFKGRFLPDQREITAEGFTASWKILQLNRNFPQFWIETDHSSDITDTAFGVDLILPVDDYQKAIRSVKYAVMTVVLTFLVFFLVEILNGRKIHPFQYALVGIALCLFYILLVSISEHLNFNLAYIISALAVIGMITTYAISIFGSHKLSLLLAIALAGIYGFLFITLQLADYALLLGSIGLTIILGLTMYFTRNINWYELSIGKKEFSTE
jgi:inner membrane protein